LNCGSQSATLIPLSKSVNGRGSLFVDTLWACVCHSMDPFNAQIHIVPNVSPLSIYVQPRKPLHLLEEQIEWWAATTVTTCSAVE